MSEKVIVSGPQYDAYEVERYQLSRAVGLLMDLSKVIHGNPRYDWNADPENFTRRTSPRPKTLSLRRGDE